MTHLLVGNPTAQSGKNAERIERAQKLLESGGAKVELFSTLPGGQTIPKLAELLAKENHASVISMGGDGTFREVGAALIESGAAEKIAMGMIPTGTANDQGRSFGLEAREEALAKNVEVILAANETRLDAGKIQATRGSDSRREKTLFFDSAGWGLSARVLASRNEDRKVVAGLGPIKEIYRDELVYVGAFLKTFLDSYVVDDKFAADIVADGKEVKLDGLTDLIVKATRIYAGAWVFDRTSAHDDGMFEVVPFRGKRDWASKAIVDLQGNPLTEEMLNAVGIEHSKPFRASRLTMKFREPKDGAKLAAQIDGEEFFAGDSVEIEVLPRAIRLIVPRG
ncbi:MAG: diacylglycerol kinase family protein [Polyangiaceae bacterium]